MLHVESRKQHAPRCNFVDQRVQPIDEQQLDVLRRAFDGHRLAIRDSIRIADDRRHRRGAAGKGIGQGRAAATDADIGLMGKALLLHQRTRANWPSSNAAGRSSGKGTLVSMRRVQASSSGVITSRARIWYASTAWSASEASPPAA